MLRALLILSVAGLQNPIFDAMPTVPARELGGTPLNPFVSASQSPSLRGNSGAVRKPSLWSSIRFAHTKQSKDGDADEG